MKRYKLHIINLVSNPYPSYFISCICDYSHCLKFASINLVIFFLMFISGHTEDMQPLVFLHLAFSTFKNFQNGTTFWPLCEIKRGEGFKCDCYSMTNPEGKAEAL